MALVSFLLYRPYNMTTALQSSYIFLFSITWFHNIVFACVILSNLKFKIFGAWSKKWLVFLSREPQNV